MLHPVRVDRCCAEDRAHDGQFLQRRRIFSSYWMAAFCQCLQSLIRPLERGCKMDKLINNVKSDVAKGKKKKAMKDIQVLLKADKKFDAKLEKCDKKMGKKK